MSARTPDNGSARGAKRRANEALVRLGAAYDSAEPIAFVCECRSAACVAAVWLNERDFRQIAKSDGFSLIAPGHAGADEHIVSVSDRYHLVRPANHVSPQIAAPEVPSPSSHVAEAYYSGL